MPLLWVAPRHLAAASSVCTRPCAPTQAEGCTCVGGLNCCGQPGTTPSRHGRAQLASHLEQQGRRGPCVQLRQQHCCRSTAHLLGPARRLLARAAAPQAAGAAAAAAARQAAGPAAQAAGTPEAAVGAWRGGGWLTALGQADPAVRGRASSSSESDQQRPAAAGAASGRAEAERLGVSCLAGDAHLCLAAPPRVCFDVP